MGGFAVATTVAREDKARSAAVAAAADDDDDETAGLLLPSLLGRRDVMMMPSWSAMLKYRDEEYDEDDSLTVIGRNIMLAR